MIFSHCPSTSRSSPRVEAAVTASWVLSSIVEAIGSGDWPEHVCLVPLFLRLYPSCWDVLSSSGYAGYQSFT
ncbi:hypothetical protein Poli38472_009715 [Pythium oligandrum]|uniref:Uncharacterized protein n=1 Tax=Pythium oligandrum TaxID=41045 RepID=A0A8K1FJW3_PYTOL|nr:hypothetical protein Poli38472_009715 [Pythium oligandrum]|eukprot:TMW62222.1 hypothetical protein Poli38472_009715 [Pythium oligandrum]